MKREQSFGIVPLKRGKQGWKVFLIQHRQGRYWGFPKGHAEAGETPQEAALRELKEETNLDLLHFLQDEPLAEHYEFLWEGKKIFKEVFYFVAEVQGEVKLQQEEIQGGMWLSLAEGLKQLTHPEGRAILTAAMQNLFPSPKKK